MTEALITREQAVELIREQMSVSGRKDKPCERRHYGRMELRDLLDAIFGSGECSLGEPFFDYDEDYDYVKWRDPSQVHPSRRP